MNEEELLRRYYVAQKRVNGEFSGDISGDWRRLRDEVNEYSLRRFGRPFDFGEDEDIYDPAWMREED